MKFCQDHWDRLRAAIDERGLSDLVAKGGERAVINLKSELEDGPSIVNFDPLMGAHWAIVNNAMNVLGLAVMAPAENGDGQCPLCLLNAWHEDVCADPACTLPKVNGYDGWIDRAADDMRAEADRLRSAG